MYIIDSSSFSYRAFYAVGSLSARGGMPTNAVYGFTRMLKKFINDYSPGYIAAVFDTGGLTFRHKQFAEYKARRKPAPHELILQIPWIKRVLDAYNIPVIEKEGFEADDVIASLALEAEKRGFAVYILTNDKDMMQIVCSRIRLLNPLKGGTVCGREEVKQRFGVYPDRIVHLLALAGDSSDNISGVPGVGEKTAARLLNEFGDIDGIFGHTGSIRPGLKTAIEDNRERIKENISLISLKKDIELDIYPEDCLFKGPDIPALRQIFTELEFKAMLKDIAGRDIKKDQVFHSPCERKEWKDILHSIPVPGRIAVTEEGFAYEKNEAVQSVYFADIKDADVWKEMKNILENKNIKKCGNDIKFLIKKGYRLAGDVLDVPIAASLAGEDVSFGTEDMPSFVYRTAGEIEEALVRGGLFQFYREVELPLIAVLAEMETGGIRVDTDVLKRLSEELGAELENLSEKIYKSAGREFNINSPKQLETVLFEDLKLSKGRHTKTGYSTDTKVLRKLCRYHILPDYILQYRQLNKLKASYIDTLPLLVNADTGRIHTTFHQAGAVTGRITSSGPNLQNIPVKTELGRRIRRAFIPSVPGSILIGADYSQIELRILAHMSGDEALTGAFNRGEDIHSLTAREIFGVDEVTKEMRRQAKIINFGVIYGMGPKALADTAGISLSAAGRFIDIYLKKYPSVAGYIDYELAFARRHGYVQTMFGRKRKIPELLSERPQTAAFGRRAAVNSPVQGTGADIIKTAMVNIYKRIKESGINARMLLQIHDELILEADINNAEALIDCVRYEMENAVKLKVPLAVDIKTGASWADI